MALSNSVAPHLLIFRVPVCIATVVRYVFLAHLAPIGSTKRLSREGLVYEQQRSA